MKRTHYLLFKFLFIFYLSCLLMPQKALSQHNLLGNSGLIIIPTAYFDGDAQVRISSGFIPHPYYPVDNSKFDNRTFFASLVFLPFIEISFGIVHPMKEVYGVGDRTTVFRFHLLREKKYRPELTIGTQDPFGIVAQDWAQRYCTLYWVASKSFDLPLIQRLNIHLGQGSSWIRAGQHYLSGSKQKNRNARVSKDNDWPAVFTGVEMQATPYTSIFAEYDTQYINWGIRVNFWHLSAMAAWLDRKYFCYSLGWDFSLVATPTGEHH